MRRIKVIALAVAVTALACAIPCSQAAAHDQLHAWLMYRIRDGVVQILLAHPGGPNFVNKDEGAWSISKGEPDMEEELLITAQRELEEETGLKPAGPFIPLQPVKQKGGKIVYAWAFEGDCDPATLNSNTFTIEWPPRSGQQKPFPEIDRADFFELEMARR